MPKLIWGPSEGITAKKSPKQQQIKKAKWLFYTAGLTEVR